MIQKIFLILFLLFWNINILSSQDEPKTAPPSMTEPKITETTSTENTEEEEEEPEETEEAEKKDETETPKVSPSTEPNDEEEEEEPEEKEETESAKEETPVEEAAPEEEVITEGTTEVIEEGAEEEITEASPSPEEASEEEATEEGETEEETVSDGEATEGETVTEEKVSPSTEFDLDIGAGESLFRLEGTATINLPLVGKIDTEISARWETAEQAQAEIAQEQAAPIITPPEQIGKGATFKTPLADTKISVFKKKLPEETKPKDDEKTKTPSKTKAKSRIVFEAKITNKIKYAGVEISEPKAEFATDGTFELVGDAKLLGRDVRAIIERKKFIDAKGKMETKFDFRGELIAKDPIKPFKKIPIPPLQQVEILDAFVGMSIKEKEKKLFLGGRASILGLPCDVILNDAGGTKISLEAGPPPEGWDLNKVSPILAPVGEVLTNFSLILSSYAFYNEKLGVNIPKGITFAAELNPMGLPGLDKMFEHFPTKPEPCILVGTLGKPSDTSFSAVIPIELTLMSKELYKSPLDIPTIKLKGLEAAVAGIPPEIGFKCSIEVNPRPKDPPLVFTGALTVDATGQFGIEGSMKGAWNKPFGIPGLVLEDVGFEFGARPEPPPVFVTPQRAGFTGTTILGDRTDPTKYVRPEVTGYLNLSSPQNVVFYGSLSQLTLKNIVSIPTNVGIKIPLEGVPNLGFKDVEFSFAPLGGEVKVGEIIKNYPAGIRFKGSTEILNKHAMVDLAVNVMPGLETGVKATAEMSKLNVGPLMIDGAGKDKVYGTKDDGPTLEIDLTPAKQEVYISGLIDFFESRGDIELYLDPTGINFDTQLKLFNVFNATLSGRTTGKKLTEKAFDLKGEVVFGREKATLDGHVDMEKAHINFFLNEFSFRDSVEAAVLLGAGFFADLKKTATVTFHPKKLKELQPKSTPTKEEKTTNKDTSTEPTKPVVYNSHFKKLLFCQSDNPSTNNQLYKKTETFSFKNINLHEKMFTENEIGMPATTDKPVTSQTSIPLSEGNDYEEEEEEEEEPEETEETEPEQVSTEEAEEEEEPEEETVETEKEETEKPEPTEEPVEEEAEEEAPAEEVTETEEADSSIEDDPSEEGPSVEEDPSEDESEEQDVEKKPLPTAPAREELEIKESELRKNLTPEQSERLDKLLKKIPNVSFKNVKFNLNFALPSFLEKEAAEFEENGIVLKSKINLPKLKLFGHAETNISQRGVIADIVLQKWKWGPLLVTGKGAAKEFGTEDDGPMGKLEFTTKKQSLYVTGLAELFGTSKAEIEIDVAADHLKFDSQLKILDLFDAEIHAKSGPNFKKFDLGGKLQFGKDNVLLKGHLGDNADETVFLFHVDSMDMASLIDVGNDVLEKLIKFRPIPAKAINWVDQSVLYYDVNFGLAFSPIEFGGYKYEKGLTFDSKLTLPYLREIKSRIKFHLGEKGLIGAGQIEKIHVGPLEVTGEGIDKKTVSPSTKESPSTDGGPMLFIELSKSPSFFFDGRVKLLGIESKTKIDIKKEGFRFETEGHLGKLFKTKLVAETIGKTADDLDFIVDGSFENDFYERLRKEIKIAFANSEHTINAGIDDAKDKVDEMNKAIKKIDAKIAKNKKEIAALKETIKKKIAGNVAKLDAAEAKVKEKEKKVKKATDKLNKAQAKVDAQKAKCERLKERPGTKGLYPGCMAGLWAAEQFLKGIQKGAYLSATAALKVEEGSLEAAKKTLVLDPKNFKENRLITQKSMAIAALESSKIPIRGTRDTAKAILEASKQTALGFTEAGKFIAEHSLDTEKMLDVKEATLHGSLRDIITKGLFPEIKIKAIVHGKEKEARFKFNIKHPVKSVEKMAAELVELAFTAKKEISR